MLALSLTLLLVSQCYAANLVDVLSNDARATTLVQLVGNADLVDTLKGGTFTIFAPTDAAFAKVPADTLTKLLADKTALADLLTYHVLSGNVKSTDLTNEMKPTMVNKGTTRINLYPHNHLNTVNGAEIVDADIVADNGVIHFIDSVIMPPTGSIVDAVANDPELSTLLTAIKTAGIESDFVSDPLTVFAPTNAAFANVDANDLQKLLGSPSRLKETLKYHEIAHTLYSKGLWNHEFPKSTDSHDDRLHVRVNADGVTINNAKVIAADIGTTNGVVHKIDHVLIPVRVGLWLRFGTGK